MRDDKDDLRFGDVKGGDQSSSTPLEGDIIDTAVDIAQALFVLLIAGYILGVVLQVLFGIDVPFVS